MPKNKTGFYAVKQGRKPGVYSTWAECEAQVNGFAGAAYKKFRTIEEANAFVGQATPQPTASTSSGSNALQIGNRVSDHVSKGMAIPTAKSSGKQTNRPAGNGTRAPGGHHDRKKTGMHRDSRTPKRPESAKQRSKTLARVAANEAADIVDDGGRATNVVCTDGACTNNGKWNAAAGIGVWWGHNDQRNISERCPGSQTNNRAELIALIRTLEEAPLGSEKSRLIIKTDSKYSIQCVQAWAQNWERRGWIKADGTEVLNAKIIQYLLALLQLRAVQGEKVVFRHVYGHSGHEGNEAADLLARNGTTKAALAERNWDAAKQRVEEVMEEMLASRSEKMRPSVSEHIEFMINEDDLLSLEELEELEKTQDF